MPCKPVLAGLESGVLGDKGNVSVVEPEIGTDNIQEIGEVKMRLKIGFVRIRS